MITVNLFDATFRHWECSTAHQRPEHVRYVRDRLEWDGVTVFTDGYLFHDVVDEVRSAAKVGWLREPRCLWPGYYERALGVAHKFDFILTYSKPLLDMERFRFTPYGGVWIQQGEWGLRPKTRLVSMLYGPKRTTQGHRMRHEIGAALAGRTQVDFYGCQGTPTTYGADTKLRVLGDYRFSVVGETCREDGLFTEILLDCFAVGTVPVFWGAPDVGAYFNAGGILPFETVADLEAILDGLSPALYADMLPAARDNLEAVGDYAVTEDWMYRHGVFGGLT